MGMVSLTLSSSSIPFCDPTCSDHWLDLCFSTCRDHCGRQHQNIVLQVLQWHALSCLHCMSFESCHIQVLHTCACSDFLAIFPFQNWRGRSLCKKKKVNMLLPMTGGVLILWVNMVLCAIKWGLHVEASGARCTTFPLCVHWECIKFSSTLDGKLDIKLATSNKCSAAWLELDRTQLLN